LIDYYYYDYDYHYYYYYQYYCKPDSLLAANALTRASAVSNSEREVLLGLAGCTKNYNCNINRRGMLSNDIFGMLVESSRSEKKNKKQQQQNQLRVQRRQCLLVPLG